MADPYILGAGPRARAGGVRCCNTPSWSARCRSCWRTIVTLESGTGLVHIAPGHGAGGFHHRRQLRSADDPAGGAVRHLWAGGRAVCRASRSTRRRRRSWHAWTAMARCWRYDTILHQYPHCWRCRGPVIFRATQQWFLAVDRFTEQALAAIDGVRWLPAWGEERMAGMVRMRPDWCISRQRVWGMPIPAFYCAQCEEPLLDARDHRTRRKHRCRRRGRMPGSAARRRDFLPDGTACPQCGGNVLPQGDGHPGRLVRLRLQPSRRAGAARAELSRPADLYLEGQDQYRGWFQVSLLTNVGTGRDGRRTARCSPTASSWIRRGASSRNRWAISSTRRRSSKKYGADILRLWVASVDVRADIVMSEDAFGAGDRGVPPHPQHRCASCWGTCTISRRRWRCPAAATGGDRPLGADTAESRWCAG